MPKNHPFGTFHHPSPISLSAPLNFLIPDYMGRIIAAMRIPLTKHGLPQVAIFPAVVLLLIAGVFALGPKLLTPLSIVACQSILLILLIWVLSFFRDPARPITTDKNLLLAPADGKIADIELVDEKTFIGPKTLRIGIFLSIFNCHINRSPCAAKVEMVTHKPGRYRMAFNADAGKINESNDIALTRLDEPLDRLLVRQISGAIARRIVCELRGGEKLAIGQVFGMIKFGSRTELYLPMREDVKCLVSVGDNVKAGLTPFVRYETSG